MDIIVDFFSSAISTGETSVLIFAILIGFILLLIWERRYDAQKRKEISEAQDALRNDLLTAYQVLKEDNERLKSKIEEVQANQELFERQVQEALAIGFAEIQKTLENITVKDIIDQIPESFKSDIQNEAFNAMNLAWKRSVEQINTQLPTMLWRGFRRNIATQDEGDSTDESLSD